MLDKAMAMVEAREAELGIEADHTTSLMARCRRALTFDERMTPAEAIEWWVAQPVAVDVTADRGQA